jgi:DNA-binding transcriptional MocR family regulator
MDDEGLVPAALSEAIVRVRASGRRIKMIYTIPSFHNPAGVSQGAQRRLEILAVAQQAGILVLEDDPYGLLGFDGEVPRAMRADDADGVIYLGSFSKTIASGLRVGWAVAPHGVREKLVLAAESAVLCPSNFAQLTISEYLATQPWPIFSTRSAGCKDLPDNKDRHLKLDHVMAIMYFTRWPD